MEPLTVPLVADRDVPVGGFLTRVLTTSQVLFDRFAAPTTEPAGGDS
jgi:hypothetical protein